MEREFEVSLLRPLCSRNGTSEAVVVKLDAAHTANLHPINMIREEEGYNNNAERDGQMKFHLDRADDTNFIRGEHHGAMAKGEDDEARVDTCLEVLFYSPKSRI